MVEVTMPAAEAAVAGTLDDERNSYEFAFHVLPTVAEGEVAGVFGELKDAITKAGGEIFDEEEPQRTELAYDITKYVEGKNRTFHSAYFGWTRLRMEGGKLADFSEVVEHRTDLLRFIIIKLTREEEALPFRYHEARKNRKIEEISEREIAAPRRKEETPAEVSAETLDESLDRITEGEDVTEVKPDTIEETKSEEKPV